MTELPHDVTLEQCVLGSILANNACLDAVAALEASDFYDPVHAFLFAAIGEFRARGAVVTPITARGIVDSCPEIVPGLSAAQYLERLITASVSVKVAGTMAELIRELAARRRMIGAAQMMLAAASDRSVNLPAAAADGVLELNDVLAMSRTRARSDMAIGDAAKLFVDRMIAGEIDARMVPTGLRDIDRKLGGWPRGGISLLAGRPSMGKTTLASSIMLNAAKAGRGVLYFSLEMPNQAITARVLSDMAFSHQAPVEYSAALRGELSDHHQRMLGEAAARVRMLPLTIDDQRGLNVAELGARVRQHQASMSRDGVELELVMVDHLGLLRPSSRYAGNKVQEVAELSDGLATIARDTNTAMVALSQLNRGVEGRDNKRPGLSDLRDSGSLEQDADVVLFAFRPAYYLERTQCEPGTDAEFKRKTMLEATRNSMEAIIAKQRNGETGVVNLFAHMPSNAVRDFAA